MAKIQYDVVNGIEVVEEFDSDVEIVEDFEMSDLNADFEGCMGASVDNATLELIREKYGFFR